MSGKDVIKAILSREGAPSNSIMANKLNISQQALSDRLNNKKRKDFSLSVFEEMLRALDYEIIVSPVGKYNKTDGVYFINGKTK